MHAVAMVYLCAVVVMLWLMNKARSSFWLLPVLALPGTFCHEVCHWVLGKVMNGQPVHFTVIPRREGRGYVLGSVSFVNLRWYNAFFVGMAPLLMLPMAYALFLWRLGAKPSLGWPEAVMVFLLANLVFGSVPSWPDLCIAAKSPIGWLLLAGGLVWVGWNLHSRPASHPVVVRSTRPRRRHPDANPPSNPQNGRESSSISGQPG